MDHHEGTPKRPIPAAPQRCSRCEGKLAMALRVQPLRSAGRDAMRGSRRVLIELALAERGAC